MHLYQRLTRQIQDQIQRGTFRPGQKLPSIRELSRQRSVSRNTVIQAYDQLAEMGLVESRNRAGFVVLATLPRTAPVQDRAEALIPSAPRPDHLALSVVRSAAAGSLAPLGSAHPSGEFPALQTFRRIHSRQQRRIRHQAVRVTPYEVPPGHSGLRQQLARHMARSEARVDADEIVITNGCQEALSLALQTLLEPGQIVAVETPSFYGTLQCIEVLGMRLLEIPSDPVRGMDLDLLQEALRRWPVRAILLNPTFNNPQGHTMSDEAARRLLGLARHYDLPVIEDDVFGDISYSAGRPRSIRSWDDEGRVLLCGSLSKSLDSDLRLGWVAAGRYREPLCYRKYVTTMASPGKLQAAAAEFLNGNRFSRHLRLISRCYRERRDRTLGLITRHLPDLARVNFPLGGFHCWIQLPDGLDSTRLYTDLLRQGISIAPGSLFSTRGQFNNCLRINYSCIDDEYKYSRIFKKISDNIKVQYDDA
ncbi:MAG: PLP-dependent aminotransferase family protein [Sedimenticola sp.]|nr:PLP-dependent aminotransferase family protein [Sedimenticola sp.]